MRIGSSDRHLTYCTNIHPGESWEQVFENLQRYIAPLKAQLSPNAPFGIGLRLSNQAVQQLLEGENLPQFQHWLRQQHLYVFTLNGFPYGGFHRQVVKDQVYAPDWTHPDRLDYTVRLAKILVALLPEGLEGSISTVPLSYKPWHEAHPAKQQTIFNNCCLNLAFLTAELVRLHEETGKLIHLDLEPEPDGLLENTADVLNFYQSWLLTSGRAWLAKILKISPEAAEEHLLNHIRICYDTCHFAVAYEQPKSVFEQLQFAGIQIGKVQISAALKLILPDDMRHRREVDARLRPFAESTYLHQVIERRPDGTLHHYPDLCAALAEEVQSLSHEWRIHFHVPIFFHDYGQLKSTQADILATFQALKQYPCPHLEIETYTWEVLPTELKTDVLTSIQREFEWTLENIDATEA